MLRFYCTYLHVKNNGPDNMATASYYNKGSDEYIDAKCSPCADKNKDQIADHYCYDCDKHLCKACLGTHNSMIKDHIIVQGNGNDTDGLTEKCGVHEDELITLFCLQHKELMCIRCLRQDHRTCKDVKHIHETTRQLSADNYNINVGIPGDGKKCAIYGCCCLSDGCLVIADNNNSRLKRVDPSSGTVTKSCGTNDEPCDVCCIGPQEVAVAFFGSTEVRVYNTKSLTRTRTIELGHRTYRIACHGGLLYCAEWCGKILYVHDVNTGRKLREICPKNTDGRELFSDIEHIALNSSGDRVYVTDYKRGLVCVGEDGRRIFCLTEEGLGLSGASGVTTDDYGHVFVCGLNSHNVVKVTEDGHVVGQILPKKDRITYPECLSYDVNRSRLYVGGQFSDQLLMVHNWKYSLY